MTSNLQFSIDMQGEMCIIKLKVVDCGLYDTFDVVRFRMNKAREQIEKNRIGDNITIEQFFSYLHNKTVRVKVRFEYGKDTTGFSSMLDIKKATMEQDQGYFINIHGDNVELVIGRKCKRVVPFMQAGVEAFFLDFDDVFVTVRENEK